MFAKYFLTFAALLLVVACSEGAAKQTASGAGEAGAPNGVRPGSSSVDEAGVPNGGQPSSVDGTGAPSAGQPGGSSGGEPAGNVGAEPDETAAIVPQMVRATPLPGGNGVFDLTALTLREGSSGPELYVAVKNVGTTPACSPALSVELFDGDEQSLATDIGGLLLRRFYRLTDGSNAIAGCVAPGDVAMLAFTDLPAELAVDDVAHVVYWCNYWVLEGSPLDGISITGVVGVARGTDDVFSGTFNNAFDVAVEAPSVAVFALNRVGRPLGVAMARGSEAVPPGGHWNFETEPVSAAGVDQTAYPTHGP